MSASRRWIARIMFTWGIMSGAMALIGGETGFYVVRFLLGAAEAGFFPGMIFFLTLWFPAMYRARIIGYFMAAIPLSTVIGAPVSGALLGLDGVLGMHGWQWLFILEAVPTAFLSGAAAAGGIAVINSIGNLAGFVGPSVMGRIKDATGSFTDGLLVLAGAAILALVIVLALGHDTALERPPAREPSPAK
jgi:MFS family permease